MKFEKLMELIKTVSASELTEFQMEENGTNIHLKKETNAFTETFVPDSDIQSLQPEKKCIFEKKSEETSEKPEGKQICSPLVGTFYAAPAEDAEPFVAVGDMVKKGQTLAIVEAMKLMNEIESEFDGKVAEIYVKNGQPVEYGQPLFRIV